MSEVNTGMDPVGTRRFPTGVDDGLGQTSAVSWAAILAGAAGAAALSLLLLILGTGLGLSAVSPWSMEGISATTFGFGAIAWLTFTQLAASGMGGYLTGRLRTKSTVVHTDEVFFRDTAHGFLTWAVASLLTAVLLTSVAGSIVSGGFRAGAAVAGGAASAVGTAASAVGTVAGTAAGSAATLAAGGTGSGEVSNIIEYYVDSLFRGDPAGTAGAAREEPQPERTEGAQTGEEGAAQQADAEQQREAPAAAQQAEQQREAPAAVQQARELAREVSEIPAGEIARIFAQALRTGTLPQEDERYIGQLIAQRTNLSQQEAEQRVSESFEEVQTTLEEAATTAREAAEEAATMAREAAEEAREASAYGAFWIFVTLLLGAFAASLMGVFGGRQRDA